MIFTHNNVELDTEQMHSFPTGQACLPFVHVHDDGTCFLETRRDRREDAHIRPIPRFEALRIASLYNLGELKQFLIDQKQGRAPQQFAAPSASTDSPTTTPFNLDIEDRETIRLINQLTPEQLDRLAESLALPQ